MLRCDMCWDYLGVAVLNPSHRLLMPSAHFWLWQTFLWQHSVDQWRRFLFKVAICSHGGFNFLQLPLLKCLPVATDISSEWWAVIQDKPLHNRGIGLGWTYKTLLNFSSCSWKSTKWFPPCVPCLLLPQFPWKQVNRLLCLKRSPFLWPFLVF